MRSFFNGKYNEVSENAPKPVVLGVPNYPVMIYRDAQGKQFKQVRYDIIQDTLYETGAIEVELIAEAQPRLAANKVISKKEIKLPKVEEIRNGT